MNITAPTPLLDVSALSSSADGRPAQIGQQVESMFASILIKSMRKTLGEDGLFPGDKSDALGGLFDMYMGQQMGQSKGLGIADMIDSYANNQIESQGSQ